MAIDKDTPTPDGVANAADDAKVEEGGGGATNPTADDKEKDMTLKEKVCLAVCSLIFALLITGLIIVPLVFLINWAKERSDADTSICLPPYKGFSLWFREDIMTTGFVDPPIYNAAAAASVNGTGSLLTGYIYNSFKSDEAHPGKRPFHVDLECQDTGDTILTSVKVEARPEMEQRYELYYAESLENRDCSLSLRGVIPFYKCTSMWTVFDTMSVPAATTITTA